MSDDRMRQEFEEWAKANGFSVRFSSNGSYYWGGIVQRWRTWKAAYQAGQKAEQAEVERLRSELAEAKAASVCPVDAAVMPSVDGLRRYADTDGRYIANCDLGYIGSPCTCKPTCTEPCKGGCGCDACRESYGDFLSSQD